MFKRCFLKRELDSLSVQTSESEVSPEPGVRGQARGAILNIVAGDSDCRASASFRACSPSVLIVEPETNRQGNAPYPLCSEERQWPGVGWGGGRVIPGN